MRGAFATRYYYGLICAIFFVAISLHFLTFKVPESKCVPWRGLCLYELYYSEPAWKVLRSKPPYKGMCVYPGKVKPLSGNVDCPSLLPVLKDLTYQGLLCEYGAIFTLSNYFTEIQGDVPWVAFQSWRANDKGFELSMNARKAMMDHAERENDSNVFYYWAAVDNFDMWENCQYHHKTCMEVFATTFWNLFVNPSKQLTSIETINFNKTMKYLPPLAAVRHGYSVCSYWMMHRDLFQEFTVFAKIFFVSLEATWDLHSDLEHCPLLFYQLYTNRNCWCFIMERLINVWIYHSGVRIVYVNPDTAELDEQVPLKERKLMLKNWFGKDSINSTISNFRSRLSPETDQLYSQLDYRHITES